MSYETTRGLLARGVRIDTHTFHGKPVNDQQEYELTRPKCLTMTRQINTKPIKLFLNHNREDLSTTPVEFGEVYKAEYDEATGDWSVDFRISTTGNDRFIWEAIKASKTAWGLSLSHEETPNGPIARDVSLCIQGGMRDGSWVIDSSDRGMKTVPYNIRTVGNS